MSKNSFTKLTEEDHEDLPTIARVNSAPPLETPADELAQHRADLHLVEKDKPTGEQTPTWIFVSTFFITTILGTGILGLPIKIAKPFLVGYSITCFMQAFTLIYTVEVLQRSHALNRAMHAGADARTWLPDLHSLGQQYLHPWLRALFDAAVMVHFVSILITYALAGTQAYVALFTSHGAEGAPDGVIQLAAVPFVCVLTALLVFGYDYIHQVISALTLVKGSLLTLLVLVTGYIAFKVSHQPYNEWIYIGSPLLVGTVALGGGMNLLPFLYAKLVAYNRADMQRLTAASVGALFFVYLLNVLWCYYLLHIVPQPELIATGEAGRISTIPLMDVIQTSYPGLRWLGLVVQVFVASSITVSFITVGTGLKHTLDGIAQGLVADAASDDTRWFTAVRRFLSRQLGSALNVRNVKYALYAAVYGLVLGVAEVNPESFFLVLEHVTSVALNLESGVFVVLMLEVARLDTLPIAWPLPPWLYAFRWAVLLFFLFAVVYGLIDMLIHRLI